MKRRDFLKALVAIPAAVVVGKAAALVPEPTPEYTGTITLGDMESDADHYWHHSDHMLDALRHNGRYTGKYKLATVSGNVNSKGIPTINMYNSTGKLTIRKFKDGLKVINGDSLLCL